MLQLLDHFTLSPKCIPPPIGPLPCPRGPPPPICPMNAKVLMLHLSLCNFPASRLLLHVGPIHMPLECAPFKEDLEFLKWHSHLMTGIQRKDKPPRLRGTNLLEVLDDCQTRGREARFPSRGLVHCFVQNFCQEPWAGRPLPIPRLG